MLRLFTIIILFLISVTSYSQFYIEGGVTYNTFNMNDMKALQKELFVEFPFPTGVTHSFDPYMGFQLSGAKIFEQENFSWQSGFMFSYTSTGGRVGYSDYSGVIRSDQLLNLTSLGIFGGIEKNSFNNKWTFNFQIPVMLDMTNFSLKSEIKIGSQAVDTERLAFRSDGISLQPRLSVFRNISTLSVGITAGYQFSIFNEDLVWSEDDSSTITLGDSNDELKAEWSGVRVGILIRYRFTI